MFKFPKTFFSSDWLEKQQSTILSAAAIITIANIASAISGLVRQRLLISFFFSTQKADFAAYTVASTIPDAVFQLIILGALSASFIPIFSHYQKQSDEEAFRMTSAMMNVLLLIFLIFSVVVFIFAEPITRSITGKGFTAHQIQVSANLTRIMLGAQFFFAISNFLTGILQTYRRFVIPAIAPLVYNIGILLGVYLFAGRFGIYSTGIGVVLGAFLHMAIQIPLAYKMGYRYKVNFNFKHPGIKTMFKLTPPRVITLGINQFQDLADNFFATSITMGEFAELSVVVISLAQQVMTLPIRFFGAPIAQAALPFLVTEAEKNDLSHFRDLLLKSINQVSFFVFPASVLILILRIPVIRIIYGTGNFPWQTTVLTARLVGIIAISIAAQSIVQVLIRAFYALKNTRTPFYITCVTVALYVTLNWFFVFNRQLGVIGMAISITLAAFVEMFLFMFFLNRRVTGMLGKAFWMPQLKMGVAAFLMAIFLYLPFRILDELVFNTSRTIELILLTISTSTIGMLVYIYFAMLFDVSELYMVRSVINKFGNWSKTLSRSQEVVLESTTGNEEM
ncbi:murein biosynthesis integral membrane protein MurJ [soil metagenome]